MMQSHAYDDTLSLEIKRELADRYFGFRRLIEEDSIELAEKVKRHAAILERRISFDLIRIYILLGNDERIQQFLLLTGIEEKLFYDHYLLESPTIRVRVFDGIQLHGFSAQGRFANLVYDCYCRLEKHSGMYWEKFQELTEDRKLINDEIEHFQKNHDLAAILGFLRGLDSKNQFGGQQVVAGPSSSTPTLIERLHIPLPDAIEAHLPPLRALPPLDTLRRPLRRLIREAYRDGGRDRMTEILQKRREDVSHSA